MEGHGCHFSIPPIVGGQEEAQIRPRLLAHLSQSSPGSYAALSTTPGNIMVAELYPPSQLLQAPLPPRCWLGRQLALLASHELSRNRTVEKDETGGDGAFKGIRVVGVTAVGWLEANDSSDDLHE